MSTGNIRPGTSMRAASGRYRESASASSVADMTAIFRSGRFPFRKDFSHASAKSHSRLRSWNSSRSTTPTPLRSGSLIIWAMKTP